MKRGIWIGLGVLAVVAGFFSASYFGLFGPGASSIFARMTTTELSWPELNTYDVRTKTGPEDLTMHDDKMVRIPGFVVPLADKMIEFEEFLLVPDAMACIHAPPPPANQMVYVKTAKPESMELTFGPVWVTGRFIIDTKGSQYGDTSFRMEAATVEPYEWGKE